MKKEDYEQELIEEIKKLTGIDTTKVGITKATIGGSAGGPISFQIEGVVTSFYDKPRSWKERLTGRR